MLQAKLSVGDWIERVCNRRLHFALGMISHIEFENQFTQTASTQPNRTSAATASSEAMMAAFVNVPGRQLDCALSANRLVEEFGPKLPLRGPDGSPIRMGWGVDVAFRLAGLARWNRRLRETGRHGRGRQLRCKHVDARA